MIEVFGLTARFTSAASLTGWTYPDEFAELSCVDAP